MTPAQAFSVVPPESHAQLLEMIGTLQPEAQAPTTSEKRQFNKDTGEYFRTNAD